VGLARTDATAWANNADTATKTRPALSPNRDQSAPGPRCSAMDTACDSIMRRAHFGNWAASLAKAVRSAQRLGARA
jgi:hypothetical protein